MEQVLKSLFPRPQHVEPLSSSYDLSARPQLLLLGDHFQLRSAATQLTTLLTSHDILPQWFARSRVSSNVSPEITLQIESALFSSPEAYRIIILSRGISLIGADEAGLFYAVVTFGQILGSVNGDSLSDSEQVSSGDVEKESVTLPGMILSDAPDIPHRGVMLDISRDKVPTMKTLFSLVETLASWKINQLQLYMEHTFAYEGHEEVWQNASPVTSKEIMDLDAHCRKFHIELVPNQNSFGHMHRWLMHDSYRGLAECPDGIEHPFNRRKEPFGLCPTDPASLSFLEDLYEQLLPNFQSRLFNVGLDETFDLGHGRSKEACERDGTANVYLNFLQKIASSARRHDSVIQFWADIVLKHKEHLSLIPPDAIGMIWGYEAGHAFAEQCKAISDAGLGFYVCPGTSSWNTFAGRTDNAIGNLKQAAIHGHEHGALGYLNTDWGDFGHMQPLPVSYLGYLAGAGFSWNTTEHHSFTEEDWVGLLNQYVFDDPSGILGQVAYSLGNAYRVTGAKSFNASPLFRLLVLCDRHAPKDIEHISKESLSQNRLFIERAVADLSDQRSQRSDADGLQREFQWVADILCFACDFASSRIDADEQEIAAIPTALREQLADRLEALLAELRIVWLLRNRIGGLEDSLQQLGFVLKKLKE